MTGVCEMCAIRTLMFAACYMMKWNATRFPLPTTPPAVWNPEGLVHDVAAEPVDLSNRIWMLLLCRHHGVYKRVIPIYYVYKRVI